MESNHLLEQLPAYYMHIKEFRHLTDSQDAEIKKLEAELQLIEDDMLIMSSSEASIKRREEMFRILADLSTEDLTFRRRRLVSRQTSSTPFTYRFLKGQLEVLCGGSDKFTLVMNPDTYQLNIVTQIGVRGGIEELWVLLERTVPLNMAIHTRNELHSTGSGVLRLGSAISMAYMVQVTHDFVSGYQPQAQIKQGTVFQSSVELKLTNDFNGEYKPSAQAKQGTVLQGYTILELK